MQRRRCLQIWLVGLGAILLAMAAVAAMRRHAHRQVKTVFYTPVTGTASWEGDWELSEKGADPSQAGSLARTDRATIPFTGTRLALRVRRDNYRGFFWIRVDDKPANRLPQTEEGAYLVLRSPDNEPETVTIPVAGGLADGPHLAEIIADYGWDHWPLVGWEVERGPDTASHDRALSALGAAAALCLAGLIGCSIEGRQRDEQDERRGATGGQPPWRPSWLGRVFEFAGTTPWLSAVFLIAAGVFYTSPWLPLTLISGGVLAGLTLLRLDLGLALVAMTAPFYRHPRPLFGKHFAMAEILILLCAVSWSFRSAARRRWEDLLPRSLSSGDRAVLLLVIIGAVSTLFAGHRHVALRELRVAILEPALFYLMVRTADLHSRDVWRIADAFVVGAVIVALIGLIQYKLNINIITAEEGFRRLRSVYGSPNNAALYLGRALPLLLAVVAFARSRRRRMTYAVFVFPVAMGLLFSFSRAAILIGVPFSLLALGILAGGRWRWIALGLIVAAIVAAIPLLGTPRFSGVLNPRAGTFFFRMQLWHASLKMFHDHPWIGVGPDNFLYQYRARYILPSAWQEPNLSHPHNILLTFATRLGLPGLVAGLWIHLAFWNHALPLRGSWNPDHRALGLGLMGAMAYGFAHGLVDASFFFVDLAIASLLALCLVQSIRRCGIHEQKH